MYSLSVNGGNEMNAKCKPKIFRLFLSFVVCCLLLCVMAGCSGSAGSSATDNELNSLQGKTLTEALDFLKNAGYEYTILNDGGDYDFTEEAKSWTQEWTDGWIVSEAKGLKGSSKECTLKITTQDSIDAKNAEQALESKLSSDAALEAVGHYGEKKFPYGFKLSYISGVGWNSITVADENTWQMKYKCEVTNEYGASRSATCEAKITGTTENPEVTEFNVY